MDNAWNWWALGAVGAAVFVAGLITLLLWPPDLKPDERMADEIHDLLNHQTGFDTSGILIRIEQGRVVLFGTVRNRSAKKLAGSIARVVADGKVSNQLAITEESHPKRNDRSFAA